MVLFVARVLLVFENLVGFVSLILLMLKIAGLPETGLKELFALMPRWISMKDCISSYLLSPLFQTRIVEIISFVEILIL